MPWICSDPKSAGVVCMCTPTTLGLVHLFLKTPRFDVWSFSTLNHLKLLFLLVKEANVTQCILWPHIPLIMCNFMFLWISERNRMKCFERRPCSSETGRVFRRLASQGSSWVCLVCSNWLERSSLSNSLAFPCWAPSRESFQAVADSEEYRRKSWCCITLQLQHRHEKSEYTHMLYLVQRHFRSCRWHGTQ